MMAVIFRRKTMACVGMGSPPLIWVSGWGTHMKSNWSVSPLAREHSALFKLLVPSVSDAFINKVLKNMELIQAVASYLPAKSAKDRAFHRWCVEVAVSWLGDGGHRSARATRRG